MEVICACSAAGECDDDMCVLITITGVLSGGLHVIKHRCAFFNHLSRQFLYHFPCTGLHCLHRQWYWRLNQGCRSMCTDCLTSQREFVTETVSFEPMNLGSESHMRGRLPNHQITGIVVTAHSARETYRSTHCCRGSTAVTSESALRNVGAFPHPVGYCDHRPLCGGKYAIQRQARASVKADSRSLPHCSRGGLTLSPTANERSSPGLCFTRTNAGNSGTSLVSLASEVSW